MDRILTPATQVLEPEGVFRKSTKHGALVPGLSVEVRGPIMPRSTVAEGVTSMAPTSDCSRHSTGITPTEQQLQQSQKQIQAQRGNKFQQQTASAPGEQQVSARARGGHCGEQGGNRGS